MTELDCINEELDWIGEEVWTALDFIGDGNGDLVKEMYRAAVEVDTQMVLDGTKENEKDV